MSKGTVKQELLDALSQLTSELQKSGKDGPHDFFANAKNRIASDCDGDRNQLVEVLERLERCAAISQYGGFDWHEDACLDRVIRAAAAMRATL